MATVPDHRPRRRHRRRHRRQQPGPPPRELGWRDIVQVDQGPLPNPGGSTGHASNFIFLADHSREITDLTLDSVKQYQEMGVFTQCGGFEIARTEERMEELRRRMSSRPRPGASRPSWSPRSS